jgi:tRNA dimethylallyltransferase
MSENKPLKQVIAVVGSTATGKTAIGVALAQWLETEVVSADSQVIYRELTIGTAKPSPEECQGVPHHMIDVAAPDEMFSAAMYQAQATEHLERLWAAGKTPVVVGGTGFYIRALLEAEFIPDVPPNPEFRQAMGELFEREGSPALHRMLAEKDPLRAGDLHPNDKVRIVRALEIIEATGKPVPRQSREKALQVHWIGPTFEEDRDLLRARIDRRIEAMMVQGWLAEVEDLVARYGPTAHALQVAHGYPELVQVILGQRSLADALEQVRINIHQYARRQMTWFRRNPAIHWLQADNATVGELQAEAKAFITQARLSGHDRLGA